MNSNFKEDIKESSPQETEWDNEEIESWDIFSIKWKQNIVNDLKAPQLYSRQVINIFSVLFSVLFGGILLAINLKTVNNKKGILPVILYSISYTVLMIFVLNSIPGRTTPFTLFFNLFGAIILYNYFWVKYIGAKFKYRTRPFWMPMIIGILIATILIWSMIVGNQI